MEKYASLLIFSLGLISTAYCACTSPEITTKSFTTQDATVLTNIAYIAEFSVKCSSGNVDSLYADVEGNIVPVAIIGDNTYQVSWTEEIKQARSGDKNVRLFDEDGYTAFRKAARAGEDTSSIGALAEVTVNHPGAFNGPWLKSELLAAILSVVIVYIAISSKAKLDA